MITAYSHTDERCYPTQCSQTQRFTYELDSIIFLPRNLLRTTCLCIKAVSLSRICKASFKPAISDSRRALRDSYVSAFAMHSFSILERYSDTASSSACTPVRSEDNSAEDLSKP